MKSPAFTVALVLLLFLADRAWAEEDPTTVEVFLRERSTSTRGWSLDGAPAPSKAGDILLVEDLWPIPRASDQPPRLDRSSDWSETTSADGQQRVVAVDLGPPRKRARPAKAEGESEIKSAEGMDPGVPNLSDEEVAGLRAVYVRGWSDEARAFLARVNPATCLVWIRGGFESVVPHLPVNLQLLMVTGPIPSDLSELARLKSLRFLVFYSGSELPVDVRPLAGLTALRVLGLPWGQLEHPEALGELRGLRQLSIARVWNLKDLTWLRTCTSLRRLDVSHTSLADLSPLGELPALEWVDAHLSPVRTLPEGPCKSLKTLRLGSTIVAPETIAAFRKLHTACDVVPGYKQTLLTAIEGTDRLRIRTGGNCHRSPEDEVVCAELTTHDTIRELLDLLEVDDCASDMSCMCCGSPTFEFYRGSDLLAAVSLHHVSHLRWSQGKWPGDVYLAGSSGPDLARWLAQHGAPESLESLDSNRRRAQAEEHRDERHLALLGTERIAALRTEIDEVDGVSRSHQALLRFEPDAERRVLLELRLLAAAGATWSSDLTYAAAYSIAEEPVEIVLKVGSAASADDETGLGFSLYLVKGYAIRGLSDAQLEEFVAPAARRLLSHADPRMREKAISGLGGVHRPFALELLRPILAGRRLEGGAIAGAAGAQTVLETPQNVILAARALLDLGDVVSLPRIREIAARSARPDRTQLLEKIEELAAGAKPR